MPPKTRRTGLASKQDEAELMCITGATPSTSNAVSSSTKSRLPAAQNSSVPTDEAEPMRVTGATPSTSTAVSSSTKSRLPAVKNSSVPTKKKATKVKSKKATQPRARGHVNNKADAARFQQLITAMKTTNNSSRRLPTEVYASTLKSNNIINFDLLSAQQTPNGIYCMFLKFARSGQLALEQVFYMDDEEFVKLPEDHHQPSLLTSLTRITSPSSRKSYGGPTCNPDTPCLL